jgi:hypothetical protein
VNRVGLAARAALALAFWAGCEAAPRPPNPQLTTLFDVQALYAGGATPDTAIATGAGLPGGIGIGHLLGADGALTVSPAWAESYSVAYVTTEVWAFFDRVWVQPMYVPVTGFMPDGTPDIVKDAGGAWRPIFGVGAGSGFYSPFWRTVYFDVPDGTPADAITSVRQVVDGGYALHTSAGLVAPLTPAGVTVTDPKAGGYQFGTGWIDGADAPFVQFPLIPFAWDEADVVEEVPLYHFLYRQPDGALAQLPIPTVVGTGPPYSNTPPPPPIGNRRSPKYSGYWRLYTVVIPPGAVVFAPPDDPLHDVLAGLGLPVLPVDQYPLVQPDAIGRVALNPTCFPMDPDPHDLVCTYLDSQANIEANIAPGDIERTGITVTCPLVSVDGLAVTP